MTKNFLSWTLVVAFASLIPNVGESLDWGSSQSPGDGRSQLARISNTGDVEIAPSAGTFASIRNQIFTHVRYTAADQETPSSNPSEIRVVAVEPTPEGDQVEIKIVHPRDNDMERSNPIDVLIRLDGYPLRTYSQFPRAKEVLNYNKTGQSIHVFVDNEPYFPKNEAIVNALQDQDIYYEQVLDFKIPFKLKTGEHLLRVFPARSYGESLKGDHCFAARVFYISAQEPKLDFNPDGPFLTYNQPQGETTYNKSKPLLLDFYITNAQLSRDGYKVRLTVDHSVQRVLTRWSPYYIYGLSKGQHTFKLELLDKDNSVVPGMTNSVTRTIVLK